MYKPCTLHRVRDRLIQGRTALINEIRGFLLERGITFPAQPIHLRKNLPIVVEDAQQNLTPRLRWLLDRLWQEWKQMEIDVQTVTDQIERISKEDARCQRLCQIPGFGPLIAAGPILATLSGLAAGGTIGGITGALVGTGIPEYEAQQYEGKLREGNVLISVHADDSGEAARVREIMIEEKADNISTGTEASVPKPHLPNEAVARREPSTKL